MYQTNAMSFNLIINRPKKKSIKHITFRDKSYSLEQIEQFSSILSFQYELPKIQAKFFVCFSTI